MIVWDGPQAHLAPAERVLRDSGFSVRVAPGRVHLPPFVRPDPTLSVRTRIAPAAVEVLRAAGFSAEEAAEQGFYHTGWEGWAIVLALAFALGLPLAALVLG